MSTELAAPAPPAPSTTIRVASVPSSHVYVRHLSAPADAHDGVVRLPEPAGPGGAPQSPWWPPRMLEAAWVRENHAGFDVFHIHFGFDARTPAQLADLAAALREHGKPLVLTMHDLRNPHHLDRVEHDAQLDVLVPTAQALVTLTPGAADAIEQRWGRRPQVIAHPHVVGLEEMAALRTARCARSTDAGQERPVRVGLHVKSLRAGMDPRTILPALVRAVDSLDHAVLQVNGHRDVLEPGGPRHDRVLAELLQSFGDRIDLRVHDFFTDEQLWTYLASLDVSVLPYRFGTHSGWLEACRDLGTQVVAPSCGFYAQQAPVESYVMDEDHFDADSLVAAVQRAASTPPDVVTVAERERQRYEIALAHRALYESLVG
jgi:beta-1,4-mannosyltransferase